MNHKIKIAYLASGTGQLFEACVRLFNEHANKHSLDLVNLGLFSDVSEGPLLYRAQALGVQLFALNSKSSDFQQELLALLKQSAPDLILSLGFKYRLSKEIIECFRGRLWNSHPSLLPKFGGHRMFGSRVHQAVFEQKESTSGFTLHEMTETLDTGPIIAQRAVEISKATSAVEIESIVKHFEREHLPNEILKALSKRFCS